MERDGENVKELRKAAGMTQAELARMVGVHKGSVARWEQGSAIPAPTFRLIEKLTADRRRRRRVRR